MSYTYKDFETGKTKRTRGKFTGWTQPTGLLKVRYAIFKNPRGTVLVPAYCLTPETKAAIAKAEVTKC
jgi:hypothetical protein